MRKLRSVVLFFSLLLLSLLFWWCKGFDRKKVNLGSSNLPGSESVKFKMMAWKIDNQFYIPLPHHLNKWTPEFEYPVLLVDFSGKMAQLEGKTGDFTMITAYSGGHRRVAEMQKNQGPEMIERAIATNVQENNGFLEFNLTQIQYGLIYKIIQRSDKNNQVLDIFLTLEPIAGDKNYFPSLHQVQDSKIAEPMLLRYTKDGKSDYLGVWFYQNKIQLPKKYSLQEYENMDFDLLLTNLNPIRLTPNTSEISENIIINYQQKFEIEQNVTEDVNITQKKEKEFLNKTCNFNDRFEVIYIDNQDGLKKQVEAVTEATNSSGIIYASENKIPCQSTVLYLIDCENNDTYLPENGTVSCLLSFESAADLIALTVIQEGNTLENPSNPLLPQATQSAGSGASIKNVSKNVEDGGNQVTILSMKISPFAQFNTGMGGWTQTDGTGMVVLDPGLKVSDKYIINLKSRDGKKETKHMVGFRFLENGATLQTSNLTVQQTNNTKTKATISQQSSEQNNIKGSNSSSLKEGQIMVNDVYFNTNSVTLIINLPNKAFVKVKRTNSGLEETPVIVGNKYNHTDPKTGDEITIYAEDGRYTRYILSVNFNINIEFTTKSNGTVVIPSNQQYFRFGAGDIDNNELVLSGLKNGKYVLEPIAAPIRKGRVAARFNKNIPFEIDNSGSFKVNLFQKNQSIINDFIALKDEKIAISFLLKYIEDPQNPLELFTFTIPLEKEVYKIKNCYDLQGIKHDQSEPQKDYVLYNDIDCKELTQTTTAFEPIPSLKGVLNGASGNPKKRYVIKNLSISKVSEDNVALFKDITQDGKVLNLTFEEPSISGNKNVAVLTANNRGAILATLVKGSSNATTSWSNTNDTKTIAGNSHLGGLVAINEGSISYSFVDGIKFSPVSGATPENIGGLVAQNTSNGIILGSFAVTRTVGSNQIGALVGNNSGTINKSYAITQNDNTNVTGNLVGSNTGTVKNSYAQLQIGANTNPSLKYRSISYDNNGSMNLQNELGSDASFKFKVGALTAEQPSGGVNLNEIVSIPSMNNNNGLSGNAPFFLKEQASNVVNTPMVQPGTGNFLNEYPSLLWHINNPTGYANLTIDELTLTRIRDNKKLNLETGNLPNLDAYTLNIATDNWNPGQTYTATILSTTITQPSELTYSLKVGGQPCTANLTGTQVNFSCPINGTIQYALNINILSAETLLQEAKFIGKLTGETDLTIISTASDKVELGGNIPNNRINRRFNYALTDVKFTGSKLTLMKDNVQMGTTCTTAPSCAMNIPIPINDLTNKTELEKYKIQIAAVDGTTKDFPFSVDYLSNENNILSVVNIVGKDNRQLTSTSSINPVVIQTAENSTDLNTYLILPVYDQENLSVYGTSFTYSNNVKEVKYGNSVLQAFNPTNIIAENFSETANEKLVVTAEDGSTKSYTIYFAYIPEVLIDNLYNIKAWDKTGTRQKDRVGAGDFSNDQLVQIKNIPNAQYEISTLFNHGGYNVKSNCSLTVANLVSILPTGCQFTKHWKNLLGKDEDIITLTLEYNSLNSKNIALQVTTSTKVQRERYKIRNWKDLQAIDDYAGNYTIENDIEFPNLGEHDFPVTGFQSIGGENSKPQKFEGTLNGNYNIIRGFKIVRNLTSSEIRKIGMFANINGGNAKIENLVLDKPILELTNTNQSAGTGLITGHLSNNAVLENIALINMKLILKRPAGFNGAVDHYAGGVVGRLDGGTISNTIVICTSEFQGVATGLVAGRIAGEYENSVGSVINTLVIGNLHKNYNSAIPAHGGVMGSDWSGRGQVLLNNVISVVGITNINNNDQQVYQQANGRISSVAGGFFQGGWAKSMVQYAENISSVNLSSDQKTITVNTFIPSFSLNDTLTDPQITTMSKEKIGRNATSQTPLHPVCIHEGSNTIINGTTFMFQLTEGGQTFNQFVAIRPTTTLHGVNTTFLSGFTKTPNSKLPIPYPSWFDQVINKLDFKVEIK